MISLINIPIMPKQIMVPLKTVYRQKATESFGDAKGSIQGLNC